MCAGPRTTAFTSAWRERTWAPRGPKGATVEALQELTRTVVQRHTEEHTSRIVVDVGGYRERRAAALRQFVTEAAADVLRTGSPEALEPMSPSDRKIVHDTVNELEGLETTSEGVEPRRYVVIRPASAQSAPEPSLASEADNGDLSEESADPGLAARGTNRRPMAGRGPVARSMLAFGCCRSPRPGAGRGAAAITYRQAATPEPDRSLRRFPGSPPPRSVRRVGPRARRRRRATGSRARGTGSGPPARPPRLGPPIRRLLELGCRGAGHRCPGRDRHRQGRGPRARRAYRGRFSAVVARSFGKPAVTAECAAPLLKVGGRLIVSEPPPTVPASPGSGGGGAPVTACSPVEGRWPEAGCAELGLRFELELARRVRVRHPPAAATAARNDIRGDREFPRNGRCSPEKNRSTRSRSRT